MTDIDIFIARQQWLSQGVVLSVTGLSGNSQQGVGGLCKVGTVLSS